MEKTADVTVENVSENLRALADLFEAIENEKVTPEMHQLAQEIDTRALAPDLRTVIGMVAGTGPSMLDYMKGDYRVELKQALESLEN